MPTGAEIQQYFIGVWRMMMGRAEGLKLLDLSADGFWNSFFAIIVALPPLIVGWVAFTNSIADVATFGSRSALLVRLFLTDIGAWVVPLAFLAAFAKPTGVADRFVHYVVASNWASALFAWVMLVPGLLRLFVPEAAELANGISLILFLATLALSWRLTVVAIAKGVAVGTAVFFAMLVVSIMTLFASQSLLGLDVAAG
ncbi:transporter [Chelativorans sp. AA-79]|uniref:transporter n=1 Tax=Chelativorans sp. AA-79 TaxID=3028735 RepID=UPI0023F68FB4|nr:transporter [Chelativorans sp. AA-79]WEX08443.1 transporter [Chelativorans sp. AA-79]